jgi:hypothetical protein
MRTFLLLLLIAMMTMSDWNKVKIGVAEMMQIMPLTHEVRALPS